MVVMPSLCSRIFDPARYDRDEMAVIEQIIGFDRALYAAENADVTEAGHDPLVHYLSQGVNEMRRPADPRAPVAGGRSWADWVLGVDAGFYADRYPDGAADPVTHALEHGLRAGRLVFAHADTEVAEALVVEAIGGARFLEMGAPDGVARFDPAAWVEVAPALTAAAGRDEVVAKPLGNRFWLAMGLGYLAQRRLGAAVCCYNFFFNGYVPTRWLGTLREGLVAVAAVSGLGEAILRRGDLLAKLDGGAPMRVAPPVFLNRSNATAQDVTVAVPQPVYGMLREVEVLGGSGLVVAGAHEVLLADGDDGRHPQRLGLIHVAGGHGVFRLPGQSVAVDAAFSMLDAGGFCFAHWLLEVLARYLVAREHGLAARMPVLVDAESAPRMQEILALLPGGAPPLIEVTPACSVRVGQFHGVSALGPRGGAASRFGAGDVAVSPLGVRMLRDLAAPLFVDLEGRFAHVLITRRAAVTRRLRNDGVVEMAMQALGLWSCDLGAASWAQQIRVISNATLIVAEADAVLANLVFCRKGATIIVLVHEHMQDEFFYLTQVAALVEARVFFFACLGLEGSHADRAQEDMIAPANVLADCVARLLREPDDADMKAAADAMAA